MRVHRLAGGLEFDVASGELRCGEAVGRLEPQPAAVLALLVDRAGLLVTHDEIRRAVWGDDTHVNFKDGVHYCIRQIRLALGDRTGGARLIETIPRRGYRLRTDALAAPDRDPVGPGLARPDGDVDRVPVRRRPAGRRRRLALAGLAVALGIVTMAVERRPNDHHRMAVAVLKTVHDAIF
jgi:DNA-binding winged helix-turn-helix (wHTH) protein